MKINDLFSVNSDLFISEFMSFIKNGKKYIIYIMLIILNIKKYTNFK